MIYPGSWTIGKIGKWKTYLDTPSHMSFASVFHRVRGEHGAEDIAGSAETIRLIASAPELLDLVKRALLSHNDLASPWVADARAVVAKIEQGKAKK